MHSEMLVYTLSYKTYADSRLGLAPRVELSDSIAGGRLAGNQHSAMAAFVVLDYPLGHVSGFSICKCKVLFTMQTSS